MIIICKKEEIEKMVGDMLQEEIIMPSTSSFSSSIVFVKRIIKEYY